MPGPHPWFRNSLIALACAGLSLSVARAREVPITILHTADLHGRIINLLPERKDDRPEAGLLRIATLVKHIREKERNVILVDLGDTIQGAPESFFSGGRVVADAMRLMKYDAAVLGNHEFDWGIDQLKAWTDMIPCPLLAANWRARIGSPPPRAESWKLIEKDGVRIALVGLTTPGIPGWSPPEYLGEWTIERSLPALERVMPAVREAKPDVIVLLVHQGLRRSAEDGANEVTAIRDRYPEFDVILGAHTHEKIAEKALGSACYAQAGWHGHELGRVDIVVDTLQHKVVRAGGTLIPVDSSVPPDPEVQAQTAPALEEARKKLDTVLGISPAARKAYVEPMSERDGAGLLREILRDATFADAAFHGALSDKDIPQGPFLERDLWRWIPYENRIGTLQLTEQELTGVIENAISAKSERFNWGISGLRVDWDPRGPEGHRVKSIFGPDGKRLHPRRRITVAFNSYDLASAGGRLPALRALTLKPETRYTLSPFDTRSVAREWIRRHWKPAARPVAAPK